MGGNKKEIRCLELHALNDQNNVLTPELINKLQDREIYVGKNITSVHNNITSLIKILLFTYENLIKI